VLRGEAMRARRREAGRELRVVLPRGAGGLGQGRQGEEKQLAGANCPPLGSAGL